MLISSHKHQMFPLAFLEYLVRHYNGIIKSNLLAVSINKFEIRFAKKPHASYETVLSLFSKLLEAFKSIKDKYHIHQDLHTQISLEMKEDEKYYIIRITGIHYIPPGKLLNLFGLILWYHIKYETGQKPGATEKGKTLTEKWKNEEELLRFKISKSKREQRVSNEVGYCFICGEEAYTINKWEFRPHENFQRLDMQTRVCKKHKMKLI